MPSMSAIPSASWLTPAHTGATEGHEGKRSVLAEM